MHGNLTASIPATSLTGLQIPTIIIIDSHQYLMTNNLSRDPVTGSENADAFFQRPINSSVGLGSNFQHVQKLMLTDRKDDCYSIKHQ